MVQKAFEDDSDVHRKILKRKNTAVSSFMFLGLLSLRINSLGSEVLKVAQTSIDALINMCKRYFQIINENLYDASLKDSSATAPEVVSISDVDLKTLKFIINIIQKSSDVESSDVDLKHPKGESMKECCLMLLNVTLEIVSVMKHLYQSDEMEKVIELHGLFISGPTASDSCLYQCKPHLALFMGGLGDVQMSESNDCTKTTAVWDLYHMLLKEQHWALVHLVIPSFGYFAAHTSCNQLWRFVPQNAALSYGVMSASEVSEQRFMSELKAFLEKEVAVLATVSASS
ncbi:unnamed protein product [Linum tenue]|uniref:Uncharacterized protein n=1 Tax=Linum tenue TaxID=586396 RepID=A0AAV0H585_9ROSI|nr:unnamed protein product [Linum tenue]